MALPRFVVLKSAYNGKYLQYVKENGAAHACLRFSGEGAVSPYAKLEIEPSKAGHGLVHLRCCYNNKYWVRKSEKQSWILAGASKPEEDRSKWSCTLFKPVVQDGSKIQFRFLHVQLNHLVTIREISGAFAYCCNARQKQPDGSGSLDVLKVTDWDTLAILPKRVAFKCDNGKFLQAHNQEGHPYLQASCWDVGVGEAAHTVFTTPEGCIRVKSNHYDRFWRGSPNWIWADSEDTTGFGTDTFFEVVKVKQNVIALRNKANGKFCKRAQWEGKMDCLSAVSPTIINDALLEVHELVISREIYDVRYHLSDARIYNEAVLSMATGDAANRTSQPNTVDVKLSYTKSVSKTWKATVSAKFGVKTTIQTSFVKIVDGKVEVSAELSAGYEWGRTDTESQTIETVHKITVKPMTRVTLSLLATKGSCDVPFSYTQHDTLTDGTMVVDKYHDGVYTGINSYNFKYETKEYPL